MPPRWSLAFTRRVMSDECDTNCPQWRPGLDGQALAGGGLLGCPPGQVLGTKELQLLVFLRFTGAVGAGQPAGHRNLADHALQGGFIKPVL